MNYLKEIFKILINKYFEYLFLLDFFDEIELLNNFAIEEPNRRESYLTESAGSGWTSRQLERR